MRIGNFNLRAKSVVMKWAVAQVSNRARASTNFPFAFLTRTIALIINCERSIRDLVLNTPAVSHCEFPLVPGLTSGVVPALFADVEAFDFVA